MTREERAALDEAIEKWVAESIRHFAIMHLRARDEKLVPQSYVQSYDAINGSLQRLRKRGVIRFVGGRWEAVKP